MLVDADSVTTPEKHFSSPLLLFARAKKKTALVDLVSARKKKNVTHIEGLLMSVLVLLHSLNGRLGRTQSR